MCIAGLVRTMACVHRTFWHIIDPLGPPDAVDTFVSISASWGFGEKAELSSADCFKTGSQVELIKHCEHDRECRVILWHHTSELHDGRPRKVFQACRSVQYNPNGQGFTFVRNSAIPPDALEALRPRNYSAAKEVYQFIFEPRAAGVGFGQATTLYNCYSMILHAEQEDGKQYDYVVRMRTDTAFRSVWGKRRLFEGYVPPVPGPFVYANSMGGCGSGNAASMHWHQEGCINDVFAVMSRSAAPAYFAEFLESYGHYGPDGTFVSSGLKLPAHTYHPGYSCPECRLGYVLHKAGVYKNEIKGMDVAILRHCLPVQRKHTYFAPNVIRLPTKPWSPPSTAKFDNSKRTRRQKREARRVSEMKRQGVWAQLRAQFNHTAERH